MNERSGVIDRFEGDQAIILFEDSKELTCPRDLLPEACKEGSSVTVTITTDRPMTDEKTQTARLLLDDILG